MISAPRVYVIVAPGSADFEPASSVTTSSALPSPIQAEIGFCDREMRFVVEPGVFKVWVGNSFEGGLEGSFTVQ